MFLLLITFSNKANAERTILNVSYDPTRELDADLVMQDLSHLIPVSTTKLAYLRQSYLPSYMRYFIGQLESSAPNNFRLN
jgi:ABC-type sulfate transport system substrate-binding protein